MSTVNSENLFATASQLIDKLISMGTDSGVIFDVCNAICAEDSESGTNQLYLDEEIFVTVSAEDTDIAKLLEKLGAEAYEEDGTCHAVPKVQFYRVLGDALAICLTQAGVDLGSFTFLTVCSKVVANMVGAQGSFGAYEDADMSQVYKNFEQLQNCTKVDYVKPYRNLVDNYIDKILVEYSKLFESGFGSRKPKGIMSTEGFYFVRDEELYLDTAFNPDGSCSTYDYVSICTVLSSVLHFKASGFGYFNPNDAIVKTNYIPRLLLYFALGCTPTGDEKYRRHEYSNNWNKYKEEVIRPYLKDTVFSQYIESVVVAGGDTESVRMGMDSLLDVMTRCCLVIEWDMKTSIKCRITSINTDFSASTIPEELFAQIYQSVGEKIVRREFGFLEFKLIKDVKKYNNEPLFAYEALDDMLSNKLVPSWEKVILGRKANDMPFIYDMSKNLAYHVVAASRMGKGVMCLGILASALGSRYPIFYLDSKPDMAITIHNICPEAAVCTAEQGVSLGINESTFETNLPKYAVNALGSTYDAFGGIIYAKMLQLILLIAEVRFKVREGGWTNISKEELGWDTERGTWTKLIAFVDELEKATVHLNDELEILKGKSEPFQATKKQIQESAGEDGTVNHLIPNAPEYAVFADRVMTWEKKLCSDLLMGSKAVMGKGQLQMIFIYQSFNQSDELKKSHNIEGIFNSLKSFPRTAKIIGGDANYYPSAALKINELGDVLNEKKRWFSLSTCEQAVLEKQSRVIEQLERGTVVPFKPYLLLNSSDMSSACVEEFLSGDPERYERYVKDGKLFEPRIGFEPYVNYMLSAGGSDATAYDLLRSGAIIANNLVRRLGFSDINDFLFDMSIGTFLSISEWLELLKNDSQVNRTASASSVVFDTEKFKPNPVSAEGSSSEAEKSRRQKMMDEYNSRSEGSTYFPTVEEIEKAIEELIARQKPKYDYVFSTKSELHDFALSVANFVKEQGGIAL